MKNIKLILLLALGLNSYAQRNGSYIENCNEVVRGILEHEIDMKFEKSYRELLIKRVKLEQNTLSEIIKLCNDNNIKFNRKENRLLKKYVKGIAKSYFSKKGILFLEKSTPYTPCAVCDLTHKNINGINYKAILISPKGGSYHYTKTMNQLIANFNKVMIRLIK